MFKLSSVALCCAMCGAVSIGSAVDAEAKKGSFARAVGIGVGVGIAKQAMKPKRDRNSLSDSDSDDDNTTAAATTLIATPVANRATAKPEPVEAMPAEPVDDGKVVCIAGCYR